MLKNNNSITKWKLKNGKMSLKYKVPTNDEDEEMEKLLSHYDMKNNNIKVFEKQEELLNELKRMELKNIELLFESNEIEQVVAENMRYNKKLETEDKSSNIYINKEIKKKDEELKEIIEKSLR